MQDLKPLMGKLSLFAKQRMGFSHPPKLFLKNDAANSQKALGKTAHYDPQDQSVTLYITARHPKDILRSLAHELVHHTQNLRGDLDPHKMGNMGSNYAQDNEHMRNMEKEAYLHGNMCFRDWEDGLEDDDKRKYKLMESLFIKENKKMKKINEIEMSNQEDQMYQLKQAKEFEKKQAAAKAAENKPGHMSNILKSLSALLADGQVTPSQLRDLADTLEDEQSRNLPGNQGYTKREIDAMDYDEYTARFRANEQVEVTEEKDKYKKKNPDDPCCDVDGCPHKKEKDDEKEKKEGGHPLDVAPPFKGKPDAKDFKKLRDDAKKKKKSEKKKTDESKIQTPEQENTLYEQRFTNKDSKLFNRLLKEWTK